MGQSQARRTNLPVPCHTELACFLPSGTAQSLPNLKFKQCNYTSLQVLQLWGFRDPRFLALPQEGLAGVRWAQERHWTEKLKARSLQSCPLDPGIGAVTPLPSVWLSCERGCLFPELL